MDAFAERKFAADKLIKQDAEGPIIRFKRVPFSFEDLRSHVMWSTNDGKSLEHVAGSKFLCCSKINQIGFAFVVDD